jgi:hypothetical protein
MFFFKVFKMRNPPCFLRSAVIATAYVIIARGGLLISLIAFGSRPPAAVGRMFFYDQSGCLSAWQLRLAFI